MTKSITKRSPLYFVNLYVAKKFSGYLDIFSQKSRYLNELSVMRINPFSFEIVIMQYELASRDTLSELFRVKSFSASLCGSVGKDFDYHACFHEFESRLT